MLSSVSALTPILCLMEGRLFNRSLLYLPHRQKGTARAHHGSSVGLDGAQKGLKIVCLPPDVQWGCAFDIFYKSTVLVSSAGPSLLPAVMQTPSCTPKLPSSALPQMSPLHGFPQLRSASSPSRPLDGKDKSEQPFSLVGVLTHGGERL